MYCTLRSARPVNARRTSVHLKATDCIIITGALLHTGQSTCKARPYLSRDTTGSSDLLHRCVGHI